MPSSTRVAPRSMARSICASSNTSGRVSTVSPTHLCSASRFLICASSNVSESMPFMASRHLLTNHS